MSSVLSAYFRFGIESHLVVRSLYRPALIYTYLSDQFHFNSNREYLHNTRHRHRDARRRRLVFAEDVLEEAPVQWTAVIGSVESLNSRGIDRYIRGTEAGDCECPQYKSCSLGTLCLMLKALLAIDHDSHLGV